MLEQLTNERMKIYIFLKSDHSREVHCTVRVVCADRHGPREPHKCGMGTLCVLGITHTRHVFIHILRPGDSMYISSVQWTARDIRMQFMPRCGYGSPPQYVCDHFTLSLSRSLFNYFSQRTRDMRTTINKSLRVVAFNCNFPPFFYFTLCSLLQTLWQLVANLWRFAITIAAATGTAAVIRCCYCCCLAVFSLSITQLIPRLGENISYCMWFGMICTSAKYFCTINMQLRIRK